MALQHIIAHRIIRNTPSDAAELKLAPSPWDIDGRTDECFREMKQCVLKRSGKEYGQFSSDRAAFPLASWLEQYSEEKMGFASFSQKAAEHLKSELDKTEYPLDAFFLMAHEKLEASELVHVFILQHNHAHCIDAELKLTDALFLDTAGIRLAAKIDLNDLQSEAAHRAQNAVMLLRWRGEKELTDVFEATVGFTEKVDISADTEEFLEVVNNYTKDLPEKVAAQTKAQVVDYCLNQDKLGKPLVIRELSTRLEDSKALDSETPYARPPKFDQFVEKTKPQAKPEMMTDKTKLRNFVRISGRNDQLSMSFASSCLGESIVYDAETDSLIIKNIPSSLKSRLIKHVQGETKE